MQPTGEQFERPGVTPEPPILDGDCQPGPSDDSVNPLLQVLGIYRRRLYPIWPIVDVHQLKIEVTTGQDEQARLLATVIRLATIAQLKLENISQDEVPRASLEDCDDRLDLDGLRVAFFLHIYHENQVPGGKKSMTYLRQALTLAQMLRLDRESSYVGLPDAEQQMRRRILWLLFVTERGVALLHKIPAFLKPNINLPSLAGEDQTHVLPAFLKLVNLFWVFDQSGILEALQNSDSDLSNMAAAARTSFDVLQSRLQDSAADYEPSNHVQNADIFVTRQWMRALLWRAGVRFGMSTSTNPFLIAKELVSFMSHLPKTAIEAHGPTLEFKTYDIATTVIDAMQSNMFCKLTDQPDEVLRGLEQILLTSRGGNKTLVTSLYLKMASISSSPQPSLTPPGQLAISSCFVMPSSAQLPWVGCEDIFRDPNGLRASDTDATNRHTLEDLNQQISWPPLDFSTPLMRSPSPLTRMIFDQLQGVDDGILPSTGNEMDGMG